MVDGDSPTLRLEQDGSSGFTPQTFDLVSNEANFFIRDVTNGSQLPFRIKPGADSNALYIDANNNIGIGTASPDSTLDIESAGPEIRFTNTGTGGGTWELSMNQNTGRLNITDDPTNARIPVKIDPDAVNNLLQVGVNGSDQVDVMGTLDVSNACMNVGGFACTAQAGGFNCVAGSCP